jgi:hypothetical protein
MDKRRLFILTIPIIFSCLSSTDAWKSLDLGNFKISIPRAWEYKKLQGEDSFIGEIIGPKVLIKFDFSNNGYANSLISTEQEYLNKKEWQNIGYFYKPGVTYTADFDVKKVKAAQMKKLGTTDSTLVRVEADPSYQTKTIVHPPTPAQKIKFPAADYIADITFKDSTIYVPIAIPDQIKSHNIKVDTTDSFIIKTIWPKEPSKGITGIYIKGKSSGLTFNMVGINLSKKDQDLALRAFKSISIK